MSTGGIRFLKFTQAVPASTWNIFHGFGTMPLIDVNVIDSNGKIQKAFPLSIIQIDANNVAISWSSDRAGYASLASTIV